MLILIVVVNDPFILVQSALRVVNGSCYSVRGGLIVEGRMGLIVLCYFILIFNFFRIIRIPTVVLLKPHAGLFLPLWPFPTFIRCCGVTGLGGRSTHPPMGGM